MRLALCVVLTMAWTPAFAQTKQEITKALAEIESKSVANFAVGAWVKITDQHGKERLITVTQKAQGTDGWQAVTSIKLLAKGDAKASEPLTITRVFGSIPDLSKQDLTGMSQETLELAGKKLKCTVFTFASGQKQWMSPELPAGGVAKIVGPKGQALWTVLAYGQP